MLQISSEGKELSETPFVAKAPYPFLCIALGCRAEGTSREQTVVFVLALWMVWELVSVVITVFEEFTCWMRPGARNYPSAEFTGLYTHPLWHLPEGFLLFIAFFASFLM